MKIIRIFISSPGDVSEERAKARAVVEQLQRLYGAHVALQAVLWEDLPLSAGTSFQDGIDVVLSDKNGIDIAVFILWSRLGSPLGGAVLKPDGSPFLSGTEREFHLMLEARKRAAGTRPQMLVYTRRDNDEFQQRLNANDIAKLSQAVEQRLLAEKFIRENFQDEGGRNIRAHHSYDKPPTFAGRLRVHLRSLIDELLGDDALSGVAWEHDPYRGLSVFDLEHAPIFFGREEEICAIEELLRRRANACCAFVVVIGASGSGKSSLARAGVAASLQRYNLDDDVKQWRVAVMQPGAIGGQPLLTLMMALANSPGAIPELLANGANPADLATILGENAALALKLVLQPAFKLAAQKAGGAVKLLLVVDQAEELWTGRQLDAEARERFLHVLNVLARSEHVWVLATLRADFYPQAQASAEFLRLKGSDGQYDLVAPKLDALQRIIAEPARLAGVRFQRREQSGKRLDQLILSDALGRDDALPLLEFALGELFLARNERRELTFDAYESMGGVEGALGQRAEAEFAQLPASAQSALGAVMHALVTVNIGAGTQAVRRNAALCTVSDTPEKSALVSELVKQRLLAADSEGGTPIVRIAHEALLRRWQRLAAWIAANRDNLRLRARVEQALEQWLQSGKDSTLLLPPGLQLEEGQALRRDAPEILAAETVNYIQLSLDRHRAAEQRRRTTRQRVTTALALLLVLALCGGVLAWLKAGAAQRALLEQRRMMFEAVLRNVEADDQLGDSPKVLSTLEPYLADPELAQHPLHSKATQFAEKARDGYRRLEAFAAKVRQRTPVVTLDLGRGISLEFVLIPAGTFQMGSPETEKAHTVYERQHVVTITTPFYMGKFHITQEQFQAVMDYNPSYFKARPKNPAEQVTWLAATAFCEKLEKQSGAAKIQLSLPTEAQWEYACRAGTTTRFNFGDDENAMAQFNWCYANCRYNASGEGTRPVGTKPPNRFGLCDMPGNVMDWCQDWFGPNYYAASPKEDPAGPASGPIIADINCAARIMRGGSWADGPPRHSSAHRDNLAPDNRFNVLGFRVVLVP